MTYVIKLRKHGILRRVLSVWYEEGQAGETENTQRSSKSVEPEEGRAGRSGKKKHSVRNSILSDSCPAFVSKIGLYHHLKFTQKAEKIG